MRVRAVIQARRPGSWYLATYEYLLLCSTSFLDGNGPYGPASAPTFLRGSARECTSHRCLESKSRHHCSPLLSELRGTSLANAGNFPAHKQTSDPVSENPRPQSTLCRAPSQPRDQDTSAARK